MSRPDGEFREFALAWGGSIRARPYDAIGHSLNVFGLYDLALSETLWRLVDGGETVVDAGANIGYTALLMASRLCGAGRVVCFEAHPVTYQELIFNVRRVESSLKGVRFECVQAALSDETGEVILSEPSDFKRNRGSARVEPSPAEQTGRKQDERRLTVKGVRLDDALESVMNIGLMKIDVEGYEAHVFRGAKRLIEGHKIRDIVFEELRGYPSPASTLLEQAGYQICEIRKTLFGPELARAHPRGEVSAWEPRNFLATLAGDRAKGRLKPRGWAILGAGG